MNSASKNSDEGRKAAQEAQAQDEEQEQQQTQEEIQIESQTQTDIAPFRKTGLILIDKKNAICPSNGACSLHFSPQEINVISTSINTNPNFILATPKLRLYCFSGSTCEYSCETATTATAVTGNNLLFNGREETVYICPFDTIYAAFDAKISDKTAIPIPANALINIDADKVANGDVSTVAAMVESAGLKQQMNSFGNVKQSEGEIEGESEGESEGEGEGDGEGEPDREEAAAGRAEERDGYYGYDDDMTYAIASMVSGLSDDQLESLCMKNLFEDYHKKTIKSKSSSSGGSNAGSGRDGVAMDSASHNGDDRVGVVHDNDKTGMSDEASSSNSNNVNGNDYSDGDDESDNRIIVNSGSFHSLASNLNEVKIVGFDEVSNGSDAMQAAMGGIIALIATGVLIIGVIIGVLCERNKHKCNKCSACLGCKTQKSTLSEAIQNNSNHKNNNFTADGIINMGNNRNMIENSNEIGFDINTSKLHLRSYNDDDEYEALSDSTENTTYGYRTSSGRDCYETI